MVKSTRRTRSIQSAKPHPDYPLTLRADGRWCRKVKGRVWYFGRDAQKALERWNAEKEAILANRNPREPRPEGPTVKKLANAYLNGRKLKLDRGELSPRSFGDTHDAVARVVDFFGAHTSLADIGPAQFTALEASYPATWGAHRRSREITQVRALFHFAEETELIQRVRFGTFRRPGKAVMMRHRSKQRQENGLKMFEAHELRAILAAASPMMKALVMLGINCGLGNSDLAALPFSALDLDGGWLNYARGKTGIERRVPLMPETVEALRKAITLRTAPTDPANANLVFLSVRGNPLVNVIIEHTKDGTVKVNPHDQISKLFRDLLTELKLRRAGRGFYALRHGTETIGGEAKDQPALDSIMGHSDGSMAATYRERIGDERLRRVVDHLRSWLYAKDESPVVLPMVQAQ